MSEEKTPIQEAEVMDWLQAHPDWLQEHPELVQGIMQSSEELQQGNIVSFERYSLQRLRKDLDEAKQKLREFIEMTERNSILVEGVLLMVENSFGAESVEALRRQLEETSMSCFEIHCGLHFNLRSDWARRLRGGLMKNKHLYYGEIDEKLAKGLFSQQVESAVICMLPPGTPKGLIAFGGETKSLFDRAKSMDSLLIEHLAAVVRSRVQIGWDEQGKEGDT